MVAFHVLLAKKKIHCYKKHLNSIRFIHIMKKQTKKTSSILGDDLSQGKKILPARVQDSQYINHNDRKFEMTFP